MKFSTPLRIILFFKWISSTISNLNFYQDNNDSAEGYSGLDNDSFTIDDPSLQDLNLTYVDYETVIEGVASPIDIYFTPCLIVIGITGNMLTVYVFFFSSLRNQSTSQYLTALAISDTIFLGDLIPPWLSTMEISHLFHQNPYCKGFQYMSYVTCSLSSWLVIAFTVERYLAVQYPLQCSFVCTVKRARYIIGALTAGAMLVNLPVLHFAGSENHVCQIDHDKLQQAAKFNWMDTTFTFTIPLILIIFFNTWIAIAIYKLEKDRVRLAQEEMRTVSMGQQKLRDSDFIYLRSQRRITNMLLIVSTTYVLLNCPAYTLRVCGYAYDMDSGELDDKWLTAQNVATMLFNANFGINFFLYCVTGQNFRRALVQTVPCFRWIARRVNALFNRNNVDHARTCSLTTSAASTGTDATSTEMSFVRPNRRRARRRTGNYIMRWTFDNSRQRRAAAMSESTEFISMQEIVSQPGPSRLFADDLARPGTSRDLSSQRTCAFIEPTQLDAEPMVTVQPRHTNFGPRRLDMESRRSGIDFRRPSPTIDSRRSLIDSRRSAIDTRRSAIDTRRSAIDTRRSAIDTRRSAIETRRPARISRGHIIETRRSAIDLRDSVAELNQPAFEPIHPAVELRRPVLSRVTVVDNPPRPSRI